MIYQLKFEFIDDEEDLSSYLRFRGWTYMSENVYEKDTTREDFENIVKCLMQIYFDEIEFSDDMEFVNTTVCI